MIFDSFLNELEKISGVQKIKRLERAYGKVKPNVLDVVFPGKLTDKRLKRRRALGEALKRAREKHARRVTGDKGARSINKKQPSDRKYGPFRIIPEALRGRQIKKYYARQAEAARYGRNQPRKRMDLAGENEFAPYPIAVLAETLSKSRKK